MGTTEDLNNIICEMKSLAGRLRQELIEKEQSNYTAQHLVRTAEVAMNFADVLPIKNDVRLLMMVKWGAMLHDAGKVRIDNTILLNKKPELSDPEMEEMKKHVYLGIKWVEDNIGIGKEVPVEIRNAILYHHENWDGTGYPEGLHGANIPYVARIIRIADTWDALTSDRSYRKAMEYEDAINVIKEESGKQFEPTMVGYFLKYLKKAKRCP